ncbi:hypothetical protein [Rhodoferax sp.]|uniref:hypothetical protein n=1 Tax=Rhodoferax sp. TaxID=50421 RepID=UPI00263641FC|nr:hypothetical protein [Rhodoferax sp.]MDD2926986.1 hypothetical protein [Rhodoferax sp.]
MQVHTTPMRTGYGAAPLPDDRLVMLEEVDFKWLMAGLGWWIDTDRLHNDRSYAIHLLDLVESTGSDVLKGCAALLRAQGGNVVHEHH